MKKIVLLLLALMPAFASLEAGIFDQVKTFFTGEEKIPKEKIKVLIFRDEPATVLEVKGKHQIIDLDTNSLILTRPGSRKHIVQATEDGIKWGDAFSNIFQLKIVPNDSTVVSVVDGVEYPGTIYVYNVAGTISIVEEIGLEEFLTLQLGNKFQQELPSEAFAAVVITARTDAHYYIKHPKNEFWSVNGTQIGYRGLNGAKPIKGLSKALHETEHMVMTNRGKGGPFAPQWGVEFGGAMATGHGLQSEITLDEAIEMAKRGDNAKEILEEAFPNTKIALID